MTSDLDTLMKQSANDAINIAQEEFDITLDKTAASVELVDTILLSFIDKYRANALEDKAVFTICNVYGAYIGEIFRQRCGGTWFYDTSNPNAPHVLLKLDDASYAFAGICYERMVNDSQISVKKYFDQAIAQHTH